MVKIIALMELATDCHTSDGIFEGPDSIIYIYKICRYANTDIIESGP